MEIKCIWEHNGGDSILYAENFVGAFTRGGSLEAATAKMPGEIRSYLKWTGEEVPEELTVSVVQEKESGLTIRDADSDVLFSAENAPLTWEEYQRLKKLALRSAEDFQHLYDSIPDKDKSCLPARTSFYGSVPRTAREMYEHTKNVNSYYFGEIGVAADNGGSIVDCRERGFALLEKQSDFLRSKAVEGSYGELWSLRKVFRRFVWHDRIHAKAMCRMAHKTFGPGRVRDAFRFELGYPESVDKAAEEALEEE